MDDSTKLMRFMAMLAINLAALIGESTTMVIYHSMYMSTGRCSYINEFNSHSDRAAKVAKKFKELGEEFEIKEE